MWHRFVNTRGGMGRNIPCDLHNEHMNRLIKFTIANMGSNLTEAALQNAVRSVSTLDTICKKFDMYRLAQVHTPQGQILWMYIKKVVSILTEQRNLVPTNGRDHGAFPGIHFDPLFEWDINGTKEWIETKKTEYIKHGQKFGSCEEENEASSDNESDKEC